MIKLIDHIKQIAPDVTFICKTGSTLFCNNCKDNDVIVCTANGDDFGRRERYENYDIFFYSIKSPEKFLNQSFNCKYIIYFLAFALAEQNADNSIYGKNPLSNFYFHDDFKKRLIDQLIIEAEKGDCNRRIFNPKNRNACLKRSIWLFANYFAISNNSLEFTEEQLDIIQKCHDNELPRSYAEDVYQKLLAMLPQSEKQVEQSTISYDELVDSKIRVRYTVSQEFAILRQRDTKPDEFDEYNAYCEQCKADAKAELGIG